MFSGDSEQLFRQVFNGTAPTLLMEPSDGRILEANAAAAAFYGWSAEHLATLRLRELNPSATSDAFSSIRPKLDRLMAVHRRADGTTSHVEIFTCPIILQRRELVYATVHHVADNETNAQPVFEQEAVQRERTAQHALLTERERLTAILRGSHVGTWEWNVQTGEAAFDERWAGIVGYAVEELHPSSIDTWMNLTHPDDLSFSAAALEQHFRGETDVYECDARMRHKDGHWVWVLDRGRVITWTADGKPLRMFGTHEDISDRKASELALQQLVAFEDLMVRATGAFFRADDADVDRVFLDVLRRVGTFAEVDRAYIFLYDDTATHMSNSHEWCAPGVTPEIDNLQDLPLDLFPQWNATLLRGETIYIHRVKELAEDWTNEREILEPQGVQSLLALPIAVGGRTMGYIGFDSVRNERAWGEEHRNVLRFLADNVALTMQRVARNNELRAATETARRLASENEQANRAKSDFLSNMSHEIRTPMNAILGYAHLIKQDPLTKRQLEQLDRMTTSAAYLLQIINDILDISKIEANKMTLEERDFEPARVIDHVCSIVSEKAVAKGLQMLVDIERVPKALRGDGGRLGQILLNLASNAIKFTESGHVVVSARPVAETASSYTIRFEVKDTGIGMTPEQTERLFNAFEQADSSTSRRFGGTGLGLAISKRLAELMGGRIGVESESGAGSRFWVELPFQTAKFGARSTTWQIVLEGLHVLVVDPDLDTRDRLVLMLGGGGLRAQGVDSSQAALATLALADRSADPFRIIFIDQRVSGGGLELARGIDGLHLQVLPTAFLLAAQGETFSPGLLDQANIARVLPKPVAPSALADALASYQRGEAPRREEGPPAAELAKRRGARILIVEDNAINRDVIGQLLETVGMAYATANDGRSAVAMVAAERFDLVLMDVQMPDMDGLEATSAIRRLPGMHDLPILALTANAFAADRERCLRAGMNDHIPKPVEPNRLWQGLVRWLPERDRRTQEPFPTLTAPPPPPPLSADLSAVEGLDTKAGLRTLGGNPTAYLRLLRQFANRHVGDAAEVQRLLSRGDQTGAIRTAHSLKGVAATLGMTTIAAMAAEAETLTKQDPPGSRLHDVLALLTAQLATMAASLLARMPLPESASDAVVPAATVDPAEVRAVLDKLQLLLTDGDTAAGDLFRESRALLRAALGADIDPLDELVQDFAYDEALTLIRTLSRTRH
jgi:PAS domain S-box-containing protein